MTGHANSGQTSTGTAANNLPKSDALNAMLPLKHVLIQKLAITPIPHNVAVAFARQDATIGPVNSGQTSMATAAHSSVKLDALVAMLPLRNVLAQYQPRHLFARQHATTGPANSGQTSMATTVPQ